MERSTSRAMTIGWTGLILLLASWGVFWFPHSMLPRGWNPSLYALAIISGLGATASGIIAGRKESKWWFFLAAGGFLTDAILVVGLAV